MYWSLLTLPLLAAIPISNAQLTGSVGPLTTVAEKAAIKTCNVLDYGAVADLSTDLGAPLVSAFNDCIDGGLVYVPEGSYAMSTWATLDKGTGWALQLDGIIYRNGTDGGNMIIIEHASDFEMFSSNSAGAMQGLGYQFHADGTSTTTRLLRLQKVTSFSVHDIILVDAPAFHLVLDTVEDGEIYNVAIRGGNEGGLDGIDITGSNVWVHDVEVTNKDECVTVKSPSSNILVESVYCNWSGGCAMGSLGADTNISDITYRNIYTWSSNQMYMIKSNGGSGTVQNVLLENFIGHGNAYSLDIDTSWAEMSTASGDGVGYSNITISNWKGTESNGLQRGPIKVLCPAGNPCYDLTIEDFAMWTESGDSQTYTCSNAYGEGFCLASGDDHVAYTATPTTVMVAPSGYSVATMAADLTAAFGTASSIPIPTIPTTFFPGVTPYSALASAPAAATASFVSSASSAGDVLAVSSLIVVPTATFSATSTATTAVSPVAASVVSASSVVSSISTSISSLSPETSSASATVGVISSITIPFASGSAAVSYTSFHTSVVSSTQSAPSAPSETSSTGVPELEETEGCPSGFEHESHAHDHVQDHGHGHLHRRRFGRH